MRKNEYFFRKYYRILCLGLALVFTFHSFGQGKQAAPGLTSEDKIIIAETIHLWQELGDRVWPGWSSTSIPIDYIKSDYEYLVGHSSLPFGYKKLEYDSGLNSDVYYKKTDMRENLATTGYIDSTKVVVIGTPDALDMNPSQWTLTTIHEMFHVYQGIMGSIEKVANLNIAYGNDASWQLKFPFPYKDEILLKAIHIQANLAYIGITTENEFECLYNSLSLLEAVQIYRELIRSKYIDLKNYKYGLFQEWTEGIAKYTEFKMVQLAAAKNYKPFPGFYNLDGYIPFKELHEDYYKKQFHAMRHCGKGVQGRLLFYYLGCAKGFLLDKAFPEWKQHYFKDGIWLDDIFDLAQPEIQNSIERVLR